MASATWSPSSLQLRLALNCRNCRKSPTILVRTQLGNPGRRIRVFCVAQDEARNENGVERRRNEGPLVGSDSTDNGFSGWSESDPVDSQSNNWFGGNDSFFFFFWLIYFLCLASRKVRGIEMKCKRKCSI